MSIAQPTSPMANTTSRPDAKTPWVRIGFVAGPVAAARGAAGRSPGSSSLRRGARSLVCPSVANAVLALHQAARIRARRHVPQRHVVRQRARQRDPRADQYRYARDDEALDQALAQETLDRDPAVDVRVTSPARLESRDDLAGGPAHLLDGAQRAGKIDWPAAQNHDTLPGVGPGVESQHRLERLPADDEGVDFGHELVVAVRFWIVGEKVELSARPGNEPVETRAHEDRCPHGEILIPVR